MRDLKLPSMYDSIVRKPEHWVHLRETGVGKRLHVSRLDGGTVGRAYEGRWEWAVILRSVSGWKVIAAGQAVTDTPKTHAEVAETLAGRARGEDGEGFDRLPRARFTQIGGKGDAHIRRSLVPVPGVDEMTWCGRPVGAPAVFDTKTPGHAKQHCIRCDAAYRAGHYGRTPVTH